MVLGAPIFAVLATVPNLELYEAVKKIWIEALRSVTKNIVFLSTDPKETNIVFQMRIKHSCSSHVVGPTRSQVTLSFRPLLMNQGRCVGDGYLASAI